MAHTCFSCNSTVSGSDCNEYLLGVNKCPTETGNCYSYIKDDILYRGCVGDDIIHTISHCKDPDFCKICSDKDNCNDVPIQKEFCITNITHSDLSRRSSKCPLALHPLGCYHLESVNENTRRGCVANLSDDESYLCRKNGDECKICIGNNCNWRKTFSQCINCNSFYHPDCVAPSEHTEIQICKGYGDNCFTFLTGELVSRGCVSDTNKIFINDCESDPDKCEICKAELGDDVCNSFSLTDTCIVCDSTREANCRRYPAMYRETICSLRTTDSLGCYLNKTDGIYRRGCMLDLDKNSQMECLDEMGNCQSCIGQNCNKKIDFQQKCQQCNGTINAFCAESYNTNHTITCPNYSTSCLIGIDANGYTHRQCSTDMDKLQFPMGFKLCFTENCNSDIFPKKRLKCYQCDDHHDCDNVEKDSSIFFKPEPCDVFMKGDQCFTYIDEGILIFILNFYLKI